MQGQLTGASASAVATIDTTCGHCGEPITIDTDGATFADAHGDAAPLVFAPQVDLRALRPNIIDGF